MIERRQIDGKQSTVAYLNNDFEPCDPEDAELVKVIFDNGDVLWLTANGSRESMDSRSEIVEGKDDEEVEGESP